MGNTITDGEPISSTITLTVGTNTYVSLADAETYFVSRLNASDWASATDDEKAQALILATQNIDGLFLKGEKYDHDQTLQFPRSYPVKDAPIRRDFGNIDGTYSETSITSDVERLVCEEALALLGGWTAVRAQLVAQGVTSFSIGNHSETLSEGSGGLSLVSGQATKLARPYIVSSVGFGG